MRVLLSKSAYVKYITRKVKLRKKTRPFIVGSEFSFFFLEICVQRPIGKCNHIHLLFLTQIIPQSPSHKHFLFPRQSPSVEQVLPQNRTLFVLGQPLEPMKTRKWKFAISLSERAFCEKINQSTFILGTIKTELNNEQTKDKRMHKMWINRSTDR